jgi:hypothetical protein
MEKLKHFKLAKQLNERFYEELLKKEAHFRGNINSCSLISLNRETPETGISNVTETNAESTLLNFNPQKPGRETPEKSLQSWIILNAIRNNHILPFGDNLTFITSELAIVLKDNKHINDILAINENNDLVVIELKSLRVNEVKEQALEFEKIIKEERDFFRQLTELMTGRNWNGNVKCAIVWPKANRESQKSQDTRYEEIEVYQYSEHSNHYTFEKL